MDVVLAAGLLTVLEVEVGTDRDTVRAPAIEPTMPRRADGAAEIANRKHPVVRHG